MPASIYPLALALALLLPQDDERDNLRKREAELIDYLLSHQKEEGTWRMSEKVPTRLASQTLLICQALMEVRNDSNRATIDTAVEKALTYCLNEIKAKRDWRIIWDHILGVPVYHRAKTLGLLNGRAADLDEAIRVSLDRLERAPDDAERDGIHGRAGHLGWLPR